jgi:2Fe-2S ferredoxin
MPKVFVTGRDGELHSFDADANRTLMESIRDHGIGELLALCGGCCSCATCHVYVDPPFAERLSPMTEDESGLLDGTMQRKQTSRLSCQIRMSDALDGLRVTIAPEE